MTDLELPDFLNRSKWRAQVARTAKIEEPAAKSSPLPDLSASANGPSREDLLFFVGQFKSVDEKIAETKTMRKKIRQQATLRGIKLDVLDRVIDEMAREDSTTLENLRDFQTYSKLLMVPIGFQMQLFDSPSQPGPSVEALNARAKREGYELGIQGLNPDEQKWLPMSPEGQAHVAGWNDGQQVLRDKFVKLNADMAAAEAEKAKKKAKKDQADADAGEEAAIN